MGGGEKAGLQKLVTDVYAGGIELSLFAGWHLLISLMRDEENSKKKEKLEIVFAGFPSYAEAGRTQCGAQGKHVC